MDGERDGRRLGDAPRSRRLDEAEQVAPALLVAGAPKPVDRAAVESVSAFEVVNLCACESARTRVIEEEETEVARLDHDPIDLASEDGRARELLPASIELRVVDVDGDARPHLEGVSHPEGRGLRRRAPLPDGCVHLRL